MIKIERDNYFYRYYCVDKYKIKRINFYDENGIIISNESGWLENNREDLHYISLDINDIPLKRKEDFSIKGAFIISCGKNYVNQLEAELYINIKLVDLRFNGYVKEYDNIRKQYVGVDFDKQPFQIYENVKWLKGQWYEYREKVEEYAKKLQSITFDTTIDELEECVKQIREYGKKMFKEKQRIDDYSLKDYIKEMESEGK